MPTIRQAAVSGMFYPDDPTALQTIIKQQLEKAPLLAHHFRAIIAPHAGYIYSGETAAYAYKQLTTIKNEIRRIVLLGPAHRIAFSGIATSSADYFKTPLGNIPIDRKSIMELQQVTIVKTLDEAHTQEHSLEVQLPFLQIVLDDFTLVPIVVGDTDKESVAEVLEFFWHDPATFFVISSDLSHFHQYSEAKTIDQQTTNAILNLQPENIGYEQACGRTPINGLLNFAQQHQLKPTLLDLRNSGDTAGTHDKVVGYGAFGFE